MKDLMNEVLEIDFLLKEQRHRVTKLFESGNAIIFGFTVDELLELKRRRDLGELKLGVK